MKKLLAMMAVMLMTGVGVAQTTAGYVPEFTNSSGAVANSVIFQLGSDIGIGTTIPAAALHVVSSSAAAATPATGFVDTYSSGVNGLTAVPFVTRAARGTPANPAAVTTNDVIGGFTGRGYYAATTNPTLPAGFSGGRGSLIVRANEPWTATAQSTYIQFNTAPLGQAFQTERMRIDNLGNVGINTVNPGGAPVLPLAAPVVLEVNGNVKMTAGSGGGITFQDGTVQTTASGAGVALSSPDGSVTVGGTASAPTVKVNTATIQAAVTGTCPAGSAMTGVNPNGTVACGTIGSGGTTASVPVIVAQPSSAQPSFTGIFGLGTPNTIYTPTASGFYRVTVYMNVPTTGTCSSAPCAGEAITLQWNDGVSTTALVTANCNLVTPCGSSAVTSMWVASGQAITAYGQSYGTGTAPSGGSYNAYVLVEKLKK